MLRPDKTDFKVVLGVGIGSWLIWMLFAACAPMHLHIGERHTHYPNGRLTDPADALLDGIDKGKDNDAEKIEKHENP